MLTRESEEILRLQCRAPHSFLMISTDQGIVVNVNGKPLGEDSRSRKTYALAVNELADEGLVNQLGEHAFDVTLAGRHIGEALIEEGRVTKMVPDTCKVIVRGETYAVSYIGANRGDLDVDEFNVHHVATFRGRTYDAHVGIFRAKSSQDEQTIWVLLSGDNIPNIGCLRARDNISRSVLDLLFKRPGWQVVRKYLLGLIPANADNVLEYPEFDLRQVAERPDTLEEYVDILDDARPHILLDCERDILEILIEDRQNRKPIGTTAAEIAASPSKRRFYSIAGHIRETLADLTDKGLIRTEDNIHYQIEIRRIADARRVVAGLPSDDLFDAPPPGQVAAYVPKSTHEFDAFLCHASEDKDAIVRPFAEAMIEIDLKPWIDEGQIRWGDNIVAKIQFGLSRSRFAVIFLSEAFLAKKWPETELNTALSIEIGGRTFVLPILLGLTHQTLQARYPIVSAKVYRELTDYNAQKTVAAEKLKELADELMHLIDHLSA